MSYSVNKVILVGNIGHTPKISTLPSGAKVANFSVATGERWKDKDTGEYKERTEWHDVSVFNEKIAEVVEKYVTKGAKVYVEGSQETRKYTGKDGTEKYKTDVVIRQYNGSIVLLDSKSSGDALPSDDDTAEPKHTTASKKVTKAMDTYKPGVKHADDDLDDIIPF